VRVEWDPEKDRANRAKHGLGFDEVQVLFEGDPEDRFLAIGPISRGVVVVAHTEPGDDVIRILSARMATRAEEELFYKYAGGPEG